MITVRVPLRISFLGGGTEIAPFVDLYGGHILGLSIKKYVYCELQTNDKAEKRGLTINIIIHGALTQYYFQHANEIDLSLITDPVSLIPLAVVFFYKDLILSRSEYTEITIEVTGENKIGIGLGTSSAVLISIIAAIESNYQIRKLESLELARTAFLIERKILNLSGGLQDQFLCALGGVNEIIFSDSNNSQVIPLKISSKFRNMLESNFYLLYLKQTRVSSDLIQNYVEKSSEDVLFKLKKLVPEGVVYFKNEDIRKFVSLIKKSWILKKQISPDIFPNSIESIISDVAESGAEFLKVLGAGGGGFSLWYVNSENKHNFVNFCKDMDFEFEPVAIDDFGVSILEDRGFHQH
jgi:D-glycero-alpha-D-manno-heptose-7-phosphate kinase